MVDDIRLNVVYFHLLSVPPLPGVSLDIIDWTLLIGNVITGGSFELTINGDFEVVYGYSQPAIQLEPDCDIIVIPEPDSCLLDLASCFDTGFTISITLSFTRFEEKMFFIGGGGENPDGQGVSFYFQYGQFHADFTTATEAWYCSFNPWELDIDFFEGFLNFDISWGSVDGLNIYLNGVVVANANFTITRVRVSTVTTTEIHIGSSLITDLAGMTVGFIVESFAVYNTTMTYLISQHVAFERKYT